jgi:ABC-type uncharacterized transport system substrate-binding protein
MSRTIPTACLAFALGLAAPAIGPAGAHPHVWVSASAVVEFGAGREVRSITVRYTLDELTTAVLIEGLDTNSNGLFEREELKATAAENAESLSEFDYFVEVRAGEERVNTPEVTAYDYSYEDGRMVLALQLALARAIDPASEDVAIRLYDPTFYVLVELEQENPLLVSGVAAEFCRVIISPPSQSGDGVSISDAVLQSFDGEYSIGRDYADVVALSCGVSG